MKDLYTENYKTWMEETEESTRKMERYPMLMNWKNSYCLNVHTIQSHLQIQCNPYQNSNGIFHRNRKTILKFLWNLKSLKVSKENLRKKNKSVGTTVPDLKLYYKVIVPKTIWQWNENTHTDLWNRIGNPEINHCIYS